MFLHLPSLKELCIRRCQNSEPLLAFMAQQIKEITEPSALKFFARSCESADGRLEHTEDLLHSVSGLEGIAVNADGADPLSVSCLLSHGQSLQCLLLGFPKDRGPETAANECTDSLYAVNDVEQLVRTCPNLQVLGISLANIVFRGWHALKMVGVSLSGRGTTPEGRQMAQALVCIYAIVVLRIKSTLTQFQYHLARLSKLRTLCLTHSPYMRFQRSARERFFRHQQLANEIFIFMAAHGSPIRYLVFHPAGHGRTEITTIINGSTWPNFYYKKGKVTASDGSDYEGVTALPISGEEFRKVKPFHEGLTSF